VLLHPSDPLNPRRPDSHYTEEYLAAREVGRKTALIDHDLAVGGDAAGAVCKVPLAHDGVYRAGCCEANPTPRSPPLLAREGPG
jgi:hypothetical protein